MSPSASFTNRAVAGAELALRFNPEACRNQTVLGLPRGGVPVAAQIAARLNAPLDVLIVRKLAHPSQPEYGLGAVSEANTLILDKDRITVSPEVLKNIINKETGELEQRINLYRNQRQLNIKGKDVILVDDGLATGVTARAASEAARKLKARKIIFAAPVCALQSLGRLNDYVDDVVCLLKPHCLNSVGNYYQDFAQVTDQEVLSLLSSARPQLL